MSVSVSVCVSVCACVRVGIKGRFRTSRTICSWAVCGRSLCPGRQANLEQLSSLVCFRAGCFSTRHCEKCAQILLDVFVADASVSSLMRFEPEMVRHPNQAENYFQGVPGHFRLNQKPRDTGGWPFEIEPEMARHSFKLRVILIWKTPWLVHFFHCGYESFESGFGKGNCAESEVSVHNV